MGGLWAGVSLCNMNSARLSKPSDLTKTLLRLFALRGAQSHNPVSELVAATRRRMPPRLARYCPVGVWV